MRFPNALSGVRKLYAAEILTIVAFILKLVGLGQAKKDNVNFRLAFVAALIGILTSVASSCLSQFGGKGFFVWIISGLFSLVMQVCEVIILIGVVPGIRSLAEQLGDHELSGKASRQIRLLVLSYIVSILLATVAVIIFINFATAIVVGGILLLASAVIHILLVIFYITLLARAKKAFTA